MQLSATAVAVRLSRSVVQVSPSLLYSIVVVPLTAFEEGTIYRMSGATTSLGDGAIEIPEDVIDPMDRCLEITVEVEPWKVVLVTPEF